MSATAMDTNPPPASAEAVPTASAAPAFANEALTIAPPFPGALTSARENPLLAVFVGPGGMYPGTRWLIYLVLGGLTFAVLASVISVIRPLDSPAWWSLISQIAFAISVISPGFLMAVIEGRPFGEFGLPWRNAFRRNFWIGTLWGFGSLSVLMFALYLSGAFFIGSLSLHGFAIVKYGAYYVVFFIFTSFIEEFMLRGYSQWVLTRGMNFWPAAALLSAGFGALHSQNSGESMAGLIAAGVIGFFFCLTLRRTGDLWWAIGFHTSWNWGESYLFSVANSGGRMPGHLFNSSFTGPEWLTGGSVGPEGSWLVFVLIAAMWVLFDRTYPSVRYADPLPGAPS